MFLEKSEAHDLTMLVLSKSQFEWENKDSTLLAKEIADEYEKIRKIIKK